MYWSLGLAAWIVQDGNYGDFTRGQHIEVAAEFAFQQQPSSGVERGCAAQLYDGSTYDLAGKVVIATRDAWVLDVGGLLVYQRRRPPVAGIGVGDIVSGRAYLGVDPSFYFESLAQQPEIPPMIYTWNVTQVLRQMAPFVEQGGILRRDPEKLGWQDVPATDAWKDDAGNAEYVLRCEVLPHAPKRTSATAT
jgi:hypothetical protein